MRSCFSPIYNNRNSSTGAVQVEAILQEQTIDHLHLEKESVAKMPLKYLWYLKSFHIFALALIVSEILKFYFLTLKK